MADKYGECSMNNLAVITARSGSKGLKDKNIKLLNGYPLIAYTIWAAQKSGMFQEIFVSTDSGQYAEIARQYGANVPFLRSEELSGDHASSWDTVREAVEQYKDIGKQFDTVALLQPTSPLRQAADIIGGYQLFQSKGADYVVSVCKMDHSPLWSNTLPDDLSMEQFIPDEVKHRSRQDLPDYYRINGALYIAGTDALDHISEMYDKGCYAYIMPQERSIDIDTELDFKIAEFLMAESVE